MSTVSDQIVRNQHFSLLELLDRLLDKGVVVKGEVLLSVADIDLVYLNLGLLLSSVKTVEQVAAKGSNRTAQMLAWQPSQEAFLDEPQPEGARNAGAPVSFVEETRQANSDPEEVVASFLPSAIDDGLDQLFQPKTNIDPENVAKGLAKLVLTLVDLIRKLMEKQAIRRIEAGQLHPGEIERMGSTFFLLDEKIEQLKTAFGLQGEDLNLDLGPLGELI